MKLLVPILLSLASLPLFAASPSFQFDEFAKNPPAWYRTAEGSNVIANVFSYEAKGGGWPKNVDTSKNLSHMKPEQMQSTFDNGATMGEMRFLAEAFNANGDTRCRDAVSRALDMIFRAQYPNGGWPQHVKPGKAYNRYITFNDDAMVHILELLREVASSNRFAFVDAERRAAAQKSFDRGIDCILKCQIKVNGKLTVWCQQHDEVTLEPRPARAFELVGFTGCESAGLLLFLMSIGNPSLEIVRAVHAGAKWFDENKIPGIRIDESGGDRRVVKDPSAPPIWARFYEIETGRPFFCGRDSVKKYDIAEIDHERRNGYRWYKYWGDDVAKRYEVWKRDHPQP